jgi:hypothetical protein
MKRVFVLFIVGVVLFGAFSAQNANAQNANNQERIIGTWVESAGGGIWVFNDNGTLTITGDSGSSSEYKFTVADTRLNLTDTNGRLEIWNIQMFSDGLELAITAADGGFWLTRQ